MEPKYRKLWPMAFDAASWWKQRLVESGSVSAEAADRFEAALEREIAFEMTKLISKLKPPIVLISQDPRKMSLHPMLEKSLEAADIDLEVAKRVLVGEMATIISNDALRTQLNNLDLPEIKRY